MASLGRAKAHDHSLDADHLVEQGALRRPRLPCGCDAQPFPLAELRKRETYGLSRSSEGA